LPKTTSPRSSSTTKDFLSTRVSYKLNLKGPSITIQTACSTSLVAIKHAIKWTLLSSTIFSANAVRLQLHALAYNLANLLRRLALPGEVERWSLTTLREKVVKIDAKVIGHGRYAIFRMAEVAAPRELFGRILEAVEAKGF
jgi:hypothetical protein